MYHNVVFLTSCRIPLVLTASLRRVEIVVSPNTGINVAISLKDVKLGIKVAGRLRIAGGNTKSITGTNCSIPYRVGLSNETKLSTTIDATKKHTVCQKIQGYDVVTLLDANNSPIGSVSVEWNGGLECGSENHIAGTDIVCLFTLVV